MKAVVLDGIAINAGDISWEPLKRLCDEITIYDRSDASEIQEHIGDADLVFTSKCQVTGEIMKACPNLKYIGEPATGYNNIDIKAAEELGIVVTNVPAYATDAVAQHTMALILELTNNVALHTASVEAGEWQNSEQFCYWLKPFILLKGRSLGIIGYGAIGKRVAEIAEAFGMTINVYSKDREAAIKSDFLSLHCPLTPENKHMINAEFIAQMKDGAYIINTARGPLIDEDALADALKSGKIAGAATDVLQVEPPVNGSPLIGLDNCFITPHMAWAPKEMRQMILDVITENLACWQQGEPKNRIV